MTRGLVVAKPPPPGISRGRCGDPAATAWLPVRRRVEQLLCGRNNRAAGGREPERARRWGDELGAALAAEQAENLMAALAIAADSIDSGAARRALDAFVDTTRSFPAS